LRGFAAKLGLDLARYDRDVNDASAAARVDGEHREGDNQGVEYVPVVYFGAQRFEGQMDVAELSAAIDARLAR
jgi:protein-disulfide isomerase